MKILFAKNICKESVNQFMEYFYNVLGSIVEKWRHNFGLHVHVAMYLEGFWGRVKLAGITKQLTIGMAFQFDLYLTERFAVSEFHLVLFLFRQPTKTSQICCCLHLKGLNSLLALNLAPLFFKFWKLQRTKFVR